MRRRFLGRLRRRLEQTWSANVLQGHSGNDNCAHSHIHHLGSARLFHCSSFDGRIGAHLGYGVRGGALRKANMGLEGSQHS
jgi:hypothetical protein